MYAAGRRIDKRGRPAAPRMLATTPPPTRSNPGTLSVVRQQRQAGDGQGGLPALEHDAACCTVSLGLGLGLGFRDSGSGQLC